MSTGYSIIPLANLVSDEEALAWLGRIGLSVPKMPQKAPNITPDSIRRVFKEWHDREMTEMLHYSNVREVGLRMEPEPTQSYKQVIIEGNERDHTNGSMAYSLRCSYGSPDFLVTVAERLAQTFGPMLLVDSVGAAVIIIPGTTADADWVDI